MPPKHVLMLNVLFQSSVMFWTFSGKYLVIRVKGANLNALKLFRGSG